MSAPKRAASRPSVEDVTALAAEATKISAADRSKAESLLAEIARRKERIAEDFYDIGVALALIAKKKLYLALGHGSFDEMLGKRNVMNTSTARALIRLVATMSRDDALAYGQEKAIALLSYARATPEVDTPKTLMETGKLPGGKAVAAASVREIKQAARTVRAIEGKSAPRSAEAKAADAEAKALSKWFHTRGVPKVGVTTARVKGALVVRIDLALTASARLRAT